MEQYADQLVLQQLQQSEAEAQRLREQVRRLEFENHTAVRTIQEREQGFWQAAGEYQMTAHQHVDNLGANMAQQHAHDIARAETAEQRDVANR